jgi:uncharacterized cupredoxin-like copper-binding protein
MRLFFKAAMLALCFGVLMCLWATTAGAAKTPRGVTVKMVDNAFKPTTLTAALGERITFTFTNRGKFDHDAFIGGTKAQATHEREMRDSDGHHGGHGDAPNAVTVEPGKRAKLVYTFKKAGTLEIGCHQPGHYDDGMVMSVVVT